VWHKNSDKRIGKCGRRRKEDGALPSNKLKKPMRGANSFLEYQALVKAPATIASLFVRDQNYHVLSAGGSMQVTLMEHGVSIHEKTCREHVNKAIDNGYVGLDHQRNEDYAAFFPSGMPTRGWYHGWLRRMKLLTGHLRSLEQTRQEWFTAENLELYFEFSKSVLLKAGVADVSPDFDPEMPYSREILITHPERICSYDETKMELDCTRGRRGKIKKCVRSDPEDDGIVVVTKSSNCASAICGRLGDVRALPAFMCFSSGDSYALAWVTHYV
jgi:hypothetical protein